MLDWEYRIEREETHDSTVQQTQTMEQHETPLFL